jgi:transposase
MAIIAQKRLFGWEEVEELGDLKRLKLVVEHLADEKLMKVLEKQRDRGRNEYPVRAVWNSVLAGVVYEHPSVEALRRELKRNGQLRQVCGFEAGRGGDAVPGSWVYSRFLRTLMKHQEEIDKMFRELVEGLREALEDFGEYVAVDGKAIRTHARGRKKGEGRTPDGRRDVDANWGVKTTRGVREDGTGWEKVKTWVGYKLHLVVDASYELPVSYRVTAASVPEIPVAREMFTGIKAEHPEVITRCTYGIADRGYDDGKLIKRLWEEYRIKPVVGIRNLRKDGEETKALGSVWNVVYGYDGRVYCENPNGEQRREMA